VPKEFILDVSELEAPEPFERIIAIVRELKSNQYLKVFHRKEPYPLYEVLIENGYCYRVIREQQADYCILIWLKSDHSTTEYCNTYSNL